MKNYNGDFKRDFAHVLTLSRLERYEFVTVMASKIKAESIYGSEDYQAYMNIERIYDYIGDFFAARSEEGWDTTETLKREWHRYHYAITRYEAAE